MNINGTYYKVSYINKLLMIDRFRLSLESLLNKPDRYYEAIKKRPKAIAKLKELFLFGFPSSFDKKHPVTDFFFNRATNTDRILMIVHREKKIDIVLQLMEKFDIDLTKNEKYILNAYRGKQ
ncbi:hypothetical protein [Nostoc phage N1]|nr:hypothetical protein [Nostoc phage N1]